MLSFDVSVTGSQVGTALSHDMEETAEALVALAQGVNENDRRELADYLQGSAPKGSEDRQKLASFALFVLEALGAAGETSLSDDDDAE